MLFSGFAAVEAVQLEGELIPTLLGSGATATQF
jgi:hypothetical protein